MGLSERKTKQRLGADRRKLAWANGTSVLVSRRRPQATRRGFLFNQKIFDRKYTPHADTSRFGQQYLEKLGWGARSGVGLGVTRLASVVGPAAAAVGTSPGRRVGTMRRCLGG